MQEITFKQLSLLNENDFLLIDVRGKDAFEYGHIRGAICVERKDLFLLPKDKKIVLYCQNGKPSGEPENLLESVGYEVFSLKGGYAEWAKNKIMESPDTVKRAEESIRIKFHKELFSRFAKGIVNYRLIQPNDKIAVCISGGKDSMLMAKLFQELKRHNKFEFNLVFIVMDPGYSKENREIIERNAAMLNIPIKIFETDIFENVFSIEKSPCYICARMRRGHLYNKAKELGCNKIALGHHYDDVIETILMGMLYGGQIQTMMPRLKSTNFEGMELIRPMYLIRERDIIRWRDYNDLNFIQCACRFTSADNEFKSDNTGHKRKKVKDLIAALAKEDPEIEQNIFKSVENVNLSTVISYKDKVGKRHVFYDDLFT